MASSINPSNIDGTYPVAGQDNDSQGFRDNFTNIKTNFTSAKTEIETLQTSSVTLSATNDFNFTGTISEALMKNNADVVNALGTVGGAVTLDHATAIIHTATLNASGTLAFSNWPASGKGGRMRFIVTIANVAHTLTLPSAVTLGATTVQGISSLVITFPATGTYIYDFSSIDGGTIVLVEDKTQSDTALGNLQVSGNAISAINTNGGITLTPNGTGVVATDNLSFDAGTVATTNTNGNLTLAPNGTGTVDLSGATATISTSTTNQALALAPNGTGTVTVPAGYKDRAGHGANSLTTKQYVDATVAGGSIANIPLRHGVTIGMMGATVANPVVITTSDGSTRSITAATQANPVVITAGTHNLSDRDRVQITSVVGMTQLNDLDFYVDVLNSTTFALYTDIWLSNGINGTGYGAYISGGEVDKFQEYDLDDGAKISIAGVVGMTELNSNTYYAKRVTSTTFQLYTDLGLTTTADGSAFTAYTSGGVISLQEQIDTGDTLTISGGTNVSVNVDTDKFTVNLDADVFGLNSLQTDVLELTTAGTPTIQTPASSNANIALNPNGSGTLLIGGTVPTITTSSGDLKLDSSAGDIVFDADIEMTSSSNGTIKTAGTNQNIILDPNGTGQISIDGNGTDATITTNNLNENLTLAPSGTGGIKLTVHAATYVATSATTGAASSLPTDPAGYLLIEINGANAKIPYYNV
jgi:hypothetical protein